MNRHQTTADYSYGAHGTDGNSRRHEWQCNQGRNCRDCDDLSPARGIVWCYVGCLAVYGLGAAAWLRWDAIVGAWEWFMRGLGAAL
jgi:hypothetical protein